MKLIKAEFCKLEEVTHPAEEMRWVDMPGGGYWRPPMREYKTKKYVSTVEIEIEGEKLCWRSEEDEWSMDNRKDDPAYHDCLYHVARNQLMHDIEKRIFRSHSR